MKKKIFLTGAVVLGLGMTACNNDDIIQKGADDGGTTFAGMYVSAIRSTDTRAINDSQNDYTGRPGESSLSTLSLISTGTSRSWTFATSEGDGKFWETGSNTGIFKVSPWKVNSGTETMALLFNPINNMQVPIATAPTMVFGSAATAKDDIAALSTDDKFIMTSSVLQKNIAPNISESTVKNGTSESENVFTFDVERVVSQGMVVKAEDLSQTTADGKGDIKLSDITYAAINGAAETYLFRNNAGERTLTVADGLYKDFKSAIDDYTDFENAQSPAGTAQAKLIRLGNLASSADGKTNEDLGNYKAIPVSANEAGAKNSRGIYFLENSVKKDAFTPANKDYGFYRLAYAKVYTTYTPKEVWHWENDKLVKKAGVEGETFYRGEKDGIIYASKEAAKKSQLSPDQKAYTYKDGKCAYRALWNRQMGDDGKSVVNADARRNNTYLLTIKAFQGLGMPWDPSDPNDPNLPKPTDPDEPENPENPDIEKEETYMRVDAKILQWNLVSREVILE
ncbi:Mfa1 family fimbria major subunit [Bacteroides zhangwenhongii]|uniref:Mfa1 family fimbria major subunit n=1 Tax=Bacteroides zhangwenhongii TaxID=2650157 RepID=UPI0022E325BC|nr:Mfa1 family fimbria major subunit [Bacteroides zhangwenhongii]